VSLQVEGSAAALTVTRQLDRTHLILPIAGTLDVFLGRTATLNVPHRRVERLRLSISIPLPAVATEGDNIFAPPNEIGSDFSKIADLRREAPDRQARWTVATGLFKTIEAGGPAGHSMNLEWNVRFLTFLLERMGERTIDRIEAAAAYRVSHHALWRIAAMRWLCALPDDAFEAFLEQNPAWVSFSSRHLNL
jgi:hypothetical protein